MCVFKVLKGIITLLIVAFVISGPFAFEAYKEQNKEKTDEKESQWQGIIVLWDYPSFDKESGTRYGWIAKKIEEFEKENRGVFIDFKPIDPEHCLPEIETAIKTNTLPDIAPVGSERAVQQLGVLEPLDSFVHEGSMDKYISGVKDSITYQGNIYGIPKLIDLHVIAFNRYELENCDSDIPKEVKWTKKDFLHLSQVVYEISKKPFIVGESTLFSIIQYLKDQGELVNLEEVNGFKRTKNIYSEFEKRDFSAISCSTMDLAKVEYALGSPGEYKLITLYNESENQYLQGNCISYGVFKQKDKQKLEMCLKLIDFITCNSEQLNLWKFNAFPVVKGVHSIYDEDSDMGQLENLIKNSNKSFINTLSTQDKVDLMKKYEER